MYVMRVNSVEGLDALRNILPYLDEGFGYAVEVRHRSWFQDLAYNFFANNNVCVWFGVNLQIYIHLLLSRQTSSMLDLSAIVM